MSWVEKVFKPKYFDILNGEPGRNRGDGFLAIFNALEQKGLFNSYSILETGCMRPGYTPQGDGQSTKLFDDFLSSNGYDGELISIDLNPEHVAFARENTNTNRVNVFCGDSVNYLWNHLPAFYTFDLIYLDSYDVDFDRPILSNLHHIKELVACSRFLRKGTIVAVDDCRFEANDPRIPPGVDHNLVGKGTFVESFMRDIQAEKIFDGYQKAWRIK